jgi:phosphate:Na+ symporter
MSYYLIYRVLYYAKQNKMSEGFLEILPTLAGGLVLFLYAISQLSQVMDGIFSDRAKNTIAKYTSNIFLSIGIGTIVTILLGSSSAVIILVIVFINAKTINFRQAIGIIMGANIGTTFTSQIIALDVGRFSIVPLIIGLILIVATKKENFRKAGHILLYFGMLFFGLFLMEQSVYPLKESPIFEEWIVSIQNNPLKGSLIGGLVTLIVQSSSATVGMAIVLAKQQLISASGGIAIMLGAELGTCSDTLIATINGSRQALKAGVFHLFFNLTTIILGLVLFNPFVQFVEWFSNSPTIDNQIANAHMIFNIGGVLFFLPFVGLTERFLNWILPEKKGKPRKNINYNS